MNKNNNNKKKFLIKINIEFSYMILFQLFITVVCELTI